MLPGPELQGLGLVGREAQNPPAGQPFFGPRSEEHTSELQSRFDLVCRLLVVLHRARRRSLFPYTTLFRSSRRTTPMAAASPVPTTTACCASCRERSSGPGSGCFRGPNCRDWVSLDERRRIRRRVSRSSG